jgi:ParB-like chromosome segregation protein Spo0J
MIESVEISKLIYLNVVPVDHDLPKAYRLAQSMEKEGQVSYIVVERCKPMTSGPYTLSDVPGSYLILAGNHRVLAARMLGWDTIMARVYAEGMSDKERKYVIDVG